MKKKRLAVKPLKNRSHSSVLLYCRSHAPSPPLLSACCKLWESLSLSVEALKWNMKCNFHPSWGICISLSVLQIHHRAAPRYRAKSWLKVQSSIEWCDDNKICFPCHLQSFLGCYLWLFAIRLDVHVTVLDIWLTLYKSRPVSAFLKRLTVTLRWGMFVRVMNQHCSQQPNRCCSPPVSREIPMVSCTGHLAPWCLSLFIVREFPITRASRGHLWAHYP